MTKNSTENTGNKTTVSNPNKPGEVEKVNPTTGGTTTEQSGVKPNKN